MGTSWQQTEQMDTNRRQKHKSHFTLTANMHKGVPYNYFKDTRNGLIKAGEADLKGHDYVRRVYHPDGKAPSLCAASGGNLEPKTLASDTKWRKANTIGMREIADCA